MLSFNIVAIIVCLQSLWTLAYGNQSNQLRSKKQKWESGDKKFMGYYKGFKMDKDNYLLENFNYSKKSSDQIEKIVASTTPAKTTTTSTACHALFKRNTLQTFVQPSVAGGYHVDLKIAGTAACKTSIPSTTSKTPVSPTKILVISGSTIEIYHADEEKREQNRLLNVTLHEPRWGAISELLNDQTVIICGGDNLLTGYVGTMSSCEILDLRTMKISKAKKGMNHPRFHGASAVLDGVPYVCGGLISAVRALSSCERYNSGEWNYIASLKAGPRFRLTMTALRGHLYAIGGSSYHLVHSGEGSNVERYNPMKDEWLLMNPMRTQRDCPSSAVLHDLLYVCGGVSVGDTCDRYNPKNDSWSSSADLNENRQCFSMFTAGDRIFALGDAWQRVEMYDEKKGKWRKLKQKLFEEDDRISAVAIP